MVKDRHRNVAYAEHKAIVDAIRRRDSVGARYAMVAHLNTARQDLAGRREQQAQGGAEGDVRAAGGEK